MGSCLEQVSGASKQHPSFSTLTICYSEGKAYLKTVLQFASEDAYVQWAKSLNKLRWAGDRKELLYLPTKQHWSGGYSPFGSRGLQLLFQPYEQTLFELVMTRQADHSYVQQTFLWSLSYSLLQYLKNFKNDQSKLNTLCFHNILVQPNGVFKFITDFITRTPPPQHPSADLRETETHLRSTSASLPQQQRRDYVQVAGVVCLAVADLLDISQLGGVSNLDWSEVSGVVKKEALRNCKLRYSTQLIEIMSDMLNTTKQHSPSYILNKMQAFCPGIQLGHFEGMQARKDALSEDSQLSKEQSGSEVKEQVSNDILEGSQCLKNTELSTKQALAIESSSSQHSFQQQAYLSIL